MGKRLEAARERLSVPMVWAETAVAVLFVLVSAIGALYLLDYVKLTDGSRVWAGRILGAFSILTLIYLAYNSSKVRGK